MYLGFKTYMKRKVIKQGHNTLTITLPNKWVKELGIVSGDELDVVENNGSIIVNGKQHSENKSTTIDLTGLRVPMIWRFFQSAYREGYNEIKLVFDPDQKNHEGVYNYYTTHFEYSGIGEPRPAVRPTIAAL